MSRIVIINQPTGNRGDESAHRALVRRLSETNSRNEIIVAFFAEEKERASQFEVKRPNLKYVYIPFIRGTKPIAKYSLKYHLGSITTLLIPVYRRMERIIRSADYIVCAPGGICMGRFMNWNHIFWLTRANKNKKPIAYYSRSFGPFLTGNKDRELFKRISINLLKSFDFLSIRDKKTMAFSDQLGISYTPSIDTAFLESPSVDISYIKKELTDKYVVFVPNTLIWQPDYKQADAMKIRVFYEKIIDKLSEHYPDYRIIMMPQLFAQGSRNDYEYFISLKKDSVYNSNITVLSDTMSSDVQQSIIKGSTIVIGARYHSIVFAINNECPFVALSYEHKMFGLLSILGLEDRQIDITAIGTDSFDDNQAISKVERLIGETVVLSSHHEKARKIADDCYRVFLDSFLVVQ